MADKLAYLKRHKWMYFLMLHFRITALILELREANGLVLSILKTSL